MSPVSAAGTGTGNQAGGPWLRNWLYHGQHLLYGVQNLSADLKTLPAIAYSHQITGVSEADGLLAAFMIFPFIAPLVSGFAALLIYVWPHLTRTAMDQVAAAGQAPSWHRIRQTAAAGSDR